MRITKGKRNSRRAHHGVTIPAYTMEGGTPRLRHRASRITGMYRGRQVLDVSKREERRKKRKNQGEATETDEKKTVEQVQSPPE